MHEADLDDIKHALENGPKSFSRKVKDLIHAYNAMKAPKAPQDAEDDYHTHLHELVKDANKFGDENQKK